jgi:hypothetical protein
MLGKRDINTRNRNEYCDYKDCQKTHVFPADKKSCKCSCYGPLLTFFRGCDVLGSEKMATYWLIMFYMQKDLKLITFSIRNIITVLTNYVLYAIGF